LADDLTILFTIQFFKMKKLLLILIAVIVSQISFGQGDGKNAPATEGPSPCPPGLCVHVKISVAVINFHKTRTNCKSGFGLCIRLGGGGISTSCVPCLNLKSTAICKVEKGVATCYGRIKNNKLELHIPAGIKEEAGFAKEDMKTFAVEKGSLSISVDGKEKVSKEGSYPVTLSGTEYIVLIEIE
jgi:hypothetical protein